MQITPTSLKVSQLFGSANEQYVIPTYQRRYSWRERQIWELIDDITLLEGTDTHLLGSIVCLSGSHVAGLNKLELVDGQQRLTTLAILLECIRERLQLEDAKDEAAALEGLLNAKPLGGKAVKKLALDSIDSNEFQWLLANDLGRTYQNEQLRHAFEIVRTWAKEQELGKLGAFLYRLKDQAIIIRLDVSEARDAFKLFETINNRGLRLSSTDIVKNFLLGNAARFGPEALAQGREHWALLLEYLDGTNPDVFFRYFLMTLTKTRVRRSQVVATFKKAFMRQVKEASALPDRHLYADEEEEEDEDGTEVTENGSAADTPDKLPVVSFKEFLSRLALSAKVYGEIVFARSSSNKINRGLRNLRMIKAVQTNGFLMHLRVGGCSDADFRKILELTESLVLRRHVCRERSSDTETLFANLCAVNPKNALAATKEKYRELCPTDERFEHEFANTNFPANLIDRARYCLERIELSKHGEHDELQVLDAQDVHVEHIIPQKIKTKKAKKDYGDWPTYLGSNADSQHARYVSRIGNMTLFAGALNIGASNNPFARKKAAYKESGIMLTKDLTTLSNFRFKNVEERSIELANLAVRLWPMP